MKHIQPNISLLQFVCLWYKSQYCLLLLI